MGIQTEVKGIPVQSISFFLADVESAKIWWCSGGLTSRQTSKIQPYPEATEHHPSPQVAYGKSFVTENS